MPHSCATPSSEGIRGGAVEPKHLPDFECQMSSPPLDTSVVDVAAAPCLGEQSVPHSESETMWESTHEPLLSDDEGMAFPLSQPDLPSRHQVPASSASVQRRRRSAACCSAPYVAVGQPQQQLLLGPLCAAIGSGVRPHAAFHFFSLHSHDRHYLLSPSIAAVLCCVLLLVPYSRIMCTIRFPAYFILSDPAAAYTPFSPRVPCEVASRGPLS